MKQSAERALVERVKAALLGKKIKSVEAEAFKTTCQGGQSVTYDLISVELDKKVGGTVQLEELVQVHGPDGQVGLARVDLLDDEHVQSIEDRYVQNILTTQCAHAGCNNGLNCKLRDAKTKQ